MMNIIKNTLRVAAVALGALTFSTSANALPVTWYLTASYDDDVTASGSYIFDADTSAFSSINITTSLNETLMFDSPSSPSSSSLLFFTEDEFGTNGEPAYTFDLATAMTNSGGLIPIVQSVLIGGAGGSFGGTCFGDIPCQGITVIRNLVSGAVTTTAPVPLPAGGALLVTAICGFGVLRRFRRTV